MPQIKQPKHPGDFQSIEIKLSASEVGQLAELLGIPNDGQPAELFSRLKEGLSYTASNLVNAEKVYFRSDMNAALRNLANAARRLQTPLAEAYRVLGGILDLWGIEHEQLKEQCELIRAKYEERRARGSMRGGEVRWYKRELDTDERKARITFFNEWARRGDRTANAFARDKKKFVALCREIVEHRLPQKG